MEYKISEGPEVAWRLWLANLCFDPVKFYDFNTVTAKHRVRTLSAFDVMCFWHLLPVSQL